MSGHYQVIWTGPYHIIVPTIRCPGKVLRNLTINLLVLLPLVTLLYCKMPNYLDQYIKCHFYSKDMYFSSALSCVKETRTYSRFTVKF